ncbi:MAG: glycosyltransferase family 2 protein [Parcubacteria group bacterium]|nr:glycosyltransferase family 2 protein [Parcubacteria group bacterium]
MKPYLSIIIPAYYEEHRIEKTLRESDKYLRSQKYDYEILVVNDGSKDKTADVVKRLVSEIANLRLIDNKINQGKGSVVRQGMLEAQGQFRLFMDADNSVSLDQVANFFPRLCGAKNAGSECFDIVIGSIEVEGAKIEEQSQWYRRALGRFSKYLIRLISGLREIHDSQRGFKIFSEKAALRIFPKQTIARWGFDIEILLIAKRQGFKIKEVPVVWINPPESKVTLKAYIKTFGELLKIKWNDIRGRYAQ